MPIEITGLDHIYITVRDMGISVPFYDRVFLQTLGFRQNRFNLNGAPHVQYYNRHFGYVIRPATAGSNPHTPYAPGLHHLCFRVDGLADLEAIALQLLDTGIACDGPAHYPEYAPDYHALHLHDPDGLHLEITNFRQERRERMEHWDQLRDPGTS